MPATHLPRELPHAEQAGQGPLRARAEMQAVLSEARAFYERGDLRSAAEAYRRILFVLPSQPSALLGLSLIARQTSQLAPALHMAQAAVAAGPLIAAAWCNLGEVLLACAQPISSFSQSGVDRRRADAARRALEQALTLDPTLPAIHMGLGNAAAQREEYTSALEHFTRAEELSLGRAAVSFALGFTASKLGRHGKAIEHYRQALLLNPSFASAWLNLGVELVADGRDQLAPPCYAQAIQSVRKLTAQANPDPLSTELSAQLNLGHLARSRQRFLSAQAAYLRALRLAEAHPHRLLEVHLALTSLEIDRQYFPQAWVSLRHAEQLPGGAEDGETANTRGILLLAEHTAGVPVSQTSSLIDEAINAFTAAEARGHKTAASNRANALLRLGRTKEALEAHENALRLDPVHPGIRYNLALTQLRAGNFAEGWQNYEIRWDFREIHPRPRRFAQPRWFGEPLTGAQRPPANGAPSSESRLSSPEFSSEFPQYSGLWNPESPALFLYAEQGLGDTLQFVRYLPQVAARMPGVALILEVQPPVERLIAEALKPGSGTSLSGLPVHLIAAGAALPEFTHHCPLMSLPALFATTLESVPTPIPYLRAPLSTARNEGPPDPTAKPFSIGIHWAGNPRYRADRERSTTLSIFEPLLAMQRTRWVSLQKGPAARQIDQLPPDLHLVDAASSDQDLADAAATIASLDLVITADSAVAHLTGALGKPLWLLLPWQADWRWMQEVETTPWYPQACLWRQSNPGDWTGLIERVRTALLDRIGDSPVLTLSGTHVIQQEPSRSCEHTKPIRPLS